MSLPPLSSFARPCLCAGLSGARVGVRTLSADRQVTAMTITTIGADFDEPLDVHRNFLAQVALHHAFAFDDLADTIYFVLTQILDGLHRIHFCLIQNASRA